LAGRCQALTSDRSQLAAVRARAAGGAAAYRILPGLISKEPLGPVVRRGDEQWLTLVRWVLFALIEAEERKVTRASVRGLQESATDPALRRFLGADGQHDNALGVKAGWVVRVIAAVGNYAEIYERNFGGESTLRIERELNRLWSDGGLLYAPPFN
jgi:general L-amino acid transport system substrate-binding protein